MFRRTFLTNSVLASVAACSPVSGMDLLSESFRKKRIIPSRLRNGATVALIAPSSPPAPEKIDNALRNLEAMGYKVKAGRHLRDINGYLAGTDANRAADIHQAFADPETDAVWCVRGGYGCTRLLPLLDFELIRKHPKILIGYSDITALHLALYQEAGMVSFHGQVGGGDMTNFTLKYLRDTLIDFPENAFDIPVFDEKMRKNDDYLPFTVVPGRAEGPLTGGNLTLLAVMAGTPYAPRFKDHIVFLEEIGEAPYRVDRMLTQLLQGSDLAQAKGIVLGVFNECIQKGSTPTLTLQECLKDRLAGLGIPVYYGAPFGHISDQCVMPYGIRAQMDADSRQIRFLEPCVR